MQEAADYLLGEHDFKSFCAVNAQSKTSVRTIYACTVTKEADIITIRVTGNGFLYNMVRIIAGTLIKVGAGEFAPQEMQTILDACDRSVAGTGSSCTRTDNDRTGVRINHGIGSFLC